MKLPRRFLYAWNHAVVSKLSETDTAKVKIPHVATLSAASKASANYARLEFRFLFGSCYN